MEYKNLKAIDDSTKKTLISTFSGIITDLKHLSIGKITSILMCIPDMCRMHHNSCENRKVKNNDKGKMHPIRPNRGEIYNALITEGIGSELSGNHLVVIVQNDKGNIYGEKVNVLPIEGDGNKINPNYQLQLNNTDLESGKLDKDPSRIIITDIMTIDKARLGRKIGKLTPEHIIKLDKSLKKQLKL